MTLKLIPSFRATYSNFAKEIHTLWQNGGNKAPLGLAISGGVDSMALASLCRSLTEDPTSSASLATESNATYKLRFIAFIVDHKVRPGSDVEAEKVSRALSRLGIESRIIPLDWQGQRDPQRRSGLETVMRRLRFQALGRACRQHGITSLLLGHHRDDQAETVLARMIKNHHGKGLRGIKSQSRIPECFGMYGVCQSGATSPRERSFVHPKRMIMLEHGGVQIFRPLLGVDKRDLIKVCEQNDVNWFEDPTNADATLTVRNGARKLLASDDLPQALRKDRLVALSVKRSKDAEAAEGAAITSLQKSTVRLDTRRARATFKIPDTVHQSVQDVSTQEAILVKMIATVSPLEKLLAKDLEPAASLVFGPYHDNEKPRDSQSEIFRIHVGGVDIVLHSRLESAPGSRRVSIHRVAPTAQEKIRKHLILWDSEVPHETREPGTQYGRWTSWQLWDGRYWVRICPPKALSSGRVRVSIAFLDEAGIRLIRQYAEYTKEKRELAQRLDLAKGSSRLTCPILVRQLIASDAGHPAKEDIGVEAAVLPTLQWSSEGWKRCDDDTPGVDAQDDWLWDIRYKHVDWPTEIPEES